MANRESKSAYAFIRIGATFGLTVGANIYILSVLLGGWLDRRWDTAPLCRLILLFVALVMSFLYLYKVVKQEEDGRRNDKNGEETQ